MKPFFVLFLIIQESIFRGEEVLSFDPYTNFSYTYIPSVGTGLRSGGQNSF